MRKSRIESYAYRVGRSLGAVILGITVGIVLMGGASAQAVVTSAQPLVGIVSTPSGHGYWQVAADGGIFSFGDAHFYGSMGGKPLNKPIVGMAATPTGGGYWLVAADGGIFSFGDAHFYGSMGGKPLNKPIVGMAATPTGGGYWLVAADGGIFSFGDAHFYGSMGGKPLNANVVGMAASPNGGGYWLVAADGGVFAFGNAGFYGSMGGKPLNAQVVGMAASPNGGGYWLVAADGGVFAFGNAGFYGSMGGKPLSGAVDTIMQTPAGNGYWLAATDGGVFAFGSATYYGRATYTPPQPPGGNYAFILPRGSINTGWLGQPHHDYPAIDIPVPAGTRYYAVTNGSVAAFTDSKCGNGLTLYGDDAAQYTYCHASSVLVKTGRVSAGTLLGYTGATGDATGAHLHFQIKIPSGTLRCPQTFLQAIFNGSVIPAVSSLPTSGCTH